MIEDCVELMTFTQKTESDGLRLKPLLLASWDFCRTLLLYLFIFVIFILVINWVRVILTIIADSLKSALERQLSRRVQNSNSSQDNENTVVYPDSSRHYVIPTEATPEHNQVNLNIPECPPDYQETEGVYDPQLPLGQPPAYETLYPNK